MFQDKVEQLKRKHEALVTRKNEKTDFYNGIYEKYCHPVLTHDHVPIAWRYDLSQESNPYLMERLGINAVFNSGAIKFGDKYILVPRVEGHDRKSFFAVAESDNGIDNFRFWDYPILFDEVEGETNIYDMRLTEHEDGYIYGVFCSEKHDGSSDDLSAAIAEAGIVRTKDLQKWERLPNLRTQSAQQRNVVLHPQFVDGKYAFYTRPLDSFIDAGGSGGIGYGVCDDITNPVIDKEVIINKRQYHTITEAKNGAGAVPIKTSKGWIHIAHGVRNTAAGLRYVIYVFATDLDDPTQCIAQPSGYFIAPYDDERIGDVSNVVFTNGCIVDGEKVFIYYASSDTRLHVATTTMDQLIDYTFNTPRDGLTAHNSIQQRMELIDKNLRNK